MKCGSTYGYVRVSTVQQKEDRQLAAMREFGVPACMVFTDKQSGKNFNRPAYQRMLKKIKPNDTLVVKSIDRLGRDYEEIKEQWRVITRELEAFIVVIDMPLLDTRQKERSLTGKLIADLALEIFSYVAETERQFIRQRQAEGVAVAMAKGVKFGRPVLGRGDAFYDLLAAWHGKEISAREAARRLGVSHTTFLAWAKEEYGRISGK